MSLIVTQKQIEQAVVAQAMALGDICGGQVLHLRFGFCDEKGNAIDVVLPAGITNAFLVAIIDEVPTVKQ